MCPPVPGRLLRRSISYRVDPMQKATAVGSRKGIPAWVVAASVGLSLVAATAIVIRWAGAPGSRLRHTLTGEAVVSAEEAEAEAEPVVLDDAPAEPARPSRGRGTTILASMTSDETASSPRPAP